MSTDNLVDRLYKTSDAVFLATDAPVADHLSNLLQEAAVHIGNLEEYASLLSRGMNDAEARGSVWGNEFE